MSGYAIRLGAGAWVEIPREAWLKLERQAGFIARHKGEPATASWGATMPVQGTTLAVGLFAGDDEDSGLPDGAGDPR
jgi:hypothetical protein